MRHKTIFLLTCLLVAAGAMAQAYPRQHASPPTVRRIALGDNLHVAGDLRLSGKAASAVVKFDLPFHSQPSAGSTLHVFLEHPSHLDGDRSFLTVTLNYGVLRSIRLDETNARMTEIAVGLPPSSIRRHNQLVFSVEQFAPEGGPALTIISPRSFLELHYTTIPMQWDLASLHESATEPAAYGPDHLSVLLPENPSSSTLQAIALLAASLCRRTSQAQPALTVVREVRRSQGPTLVVGTPSEQPALSALQGDTPLVLYRGRKRTLAGTSDPQTINQTDGFVGLRALDRGAGPAVYVTGNSPAGVLKAAQAMTNPGWSFKDSFATITGEAGWPTRGPRNWDGFLPVANSFRLYDLGYKDVPIAYPEGADIPLNATPDAAFLGYAHQMNLRLALAREFHIPGSEIVVQLNGTELARYAVQEKFPALTATLSLSIPPRLLQTENLLKVSWRGPAPATAPEATAGWVLGASEFYLPRNYEAQLPDLALLKANFYPFSLRGDLSDVLLVTPARIDAATLSALLSLVRAIARLAPADHLAFGVRRSDDLTSEDLTRYHLIFLDPGPPNRLPPQLAASLPRIPLRGGSGKGLRVLRELISPWNGQKYALLISAESAAGLSSLMEPLFSPQQMARLSGDTALLQPAETICFALGRKQQLREVSYNLATQAWLRVHWPALPVVLITVSGGLFLALRLVLHGAGKPHRGSSS